jgi:hypothetical protein
VQRRGTDPAEGADLAARGLRTRRARVSACEKSDGRIAKKIGPVLSVRSAFGWR